MLTFIQPDNVCLLIGQFNPFAFNTVTGIFGFDLMILFFVFMSRVLNLFFCPSFALVNFFNFHFFFY